MIASAIALFRTPYCDFLFYSAVSLSIFSMAAGVIRLRNSASTGWRRGTGLIGVGLIVVSVYLGGYVLLRWAASPFAQLITIVQPPPTNQISAGDTVVIWTAGPIHRGHVVVSYVNWGGIYDHVPVVSPVLAVPGDKVEIRETPPSLL
jgi:hypothetical protein